MIVYLVKGIFPFGNNLAIWSDMHEQITAMYYHFYDSVYGNSSLLVDFSSGGGINFYGIITYYISSPFTLITLLFPRNLVFQSTSIIIALKIMLSGITSLYFLNKTFKNIPEKFKILLSCLYAFSGYSLILYIITPWIDIVYLLPILIVGLNKLLNLESTKLYVIILSMSLIFNFYITFMVLIFVIFYALIYLKLFGNINNKRAIYNLGISTILSILISSVVLLPSFIQIFNSARAGINLHTIFNSKLGPFSDKVSFFFASPIILSICFLLLLEFRKHKKKCLFFALLLMFTLLPVVIEPINKILHFGSYVFFPYRYGFITLFLLITIAAYYLDKIKYKKEDNTNKKYLTIIITILTCAIMIFLTNKFYYKIQISISSLTLSSNVKNLLVLFIIFLLTFICSFSIFKLNKNSSNNNSIFIILVILTTTNVFCNCFLYIGIDHEQVSLKNKYIQMLDIYNDSNQNDNYYLKSNNRILITNNGMVTGFNTYNNFTSLTEKNNFSIMQKLGYDSYWMDTESIGGNLFTDVVLAQNIL